MSKRKRKLSTLFAGLLSAAILGVQAPSTAHMGGHDELSKEMERDPVESVQGIVLSLPCYLQYGKSGEAYERCEKSPLAQEFLSTTLLTNDGTSFLVIMDHPDAFTAVRKLLSARVLAIGRVVERGHLKAIVLRSIRKARSLKE
jgi:hypothetical protein